MFLKLFTQTSDQSTPMGPHKPITLTKKEFRLEEIYTKKNFRKKSFFLQKGRNCITNLNIKFFLLYTHKYIYKVNKIKKGNKSL